MNCTEYLFKLSLHQRKFNDVKLWIKQGRLCGNVIIGYLKQKGFPEVALQFVEDQHTRFNLALEYGHIEEAMGAAQELDDTACWTRLGAEALRQGNQQIVEMVYQKTKHFDALSFLYLVTGNIAKLRKMLKISEMRHDVMSRFNNAVMLGNVEERIKIMAEMGQVPLAALTARAHNVQEMLPRLEEQLQGVDVAAQLPAKSRLMLPPVPLVQPGSGDRVNWPLLTSVREIFERNALERAAQAAQQMPVDDDFAQEDDAPPEETGNADAWGADDLGLADEGAWGTGMDDLGLDDVDLAVAEPVAAVADARTVAAGQTLQQKWIQKRKLPVDYAAAGEFDEALGLLQRRIGLMNADPLEPLFQEIYWATCSSLPSMPQAPSIPLPMTANGRAKDVELAPANLFNVQAMVEGMKEGHKLTTQGKFGEALDRLRMLLQALPLSCAVNSEEEQQLQEMVEMSREYVNMLRLETTRKTIGADQMVRNIELAAYLTCCKLQPAHMVLTLRLAMTTAFKAENFVTAASFARRLVQGNMGGQDVVTQARKLLAVAEQKGSDKHTINFDPRASIDEFTLCAGSLTPVKAADPTVRCPYCSAVYQTSFRGKLCDVCQLSEVGATVLGVQFKPI